MDLSTESFSFKALFTPLTTSKALHILICVGIILFSSSLFNDFVGDDLSQTIENPVITSMQNLNIFFNGSTYYNGGNMTGIYYRPLQTLMFSVIYHVFGSSPFGFHLIQVIFHISSTCLLFLFFKHFFRREVSLVLALIFLVHPMNSEAVFSISSLQDVLYLFFGMLALWIMVSFHSKRSFIFVSIALLLSLFAKETGILFFVIAAIYLLFFKKKHILLKLGTFGALICLYLALRIHAVGFFPETASVPISKLSFWMRMVNVPEMFLFYVKTFFFPLDLVSSYQWFYTKITFSHFFLPAVLDLLFIGIIVWGIISLFKRSPGKNVKYYIFFCTWFFIGIFLHLHILTLDATVAERWFYFASIGLLGMIGVYLNTFRPPISQTWRLVIIFVIMIVLSTRTMVRSVDWKDELTLDTHDIRVSDTYDLENGISFALIKQGRLEEAKVHALRSITLYPYLTNYINLGVIYTRLGEYQKAKETYQKALQFGDYYLVYDNLGGLTLLIGDLDDNKDFLKRALTKFPQDGKLWLYLAILEYKSGDITQAKDAVTKASFYDNSQSTRSVYEAIIKNKELHLNVK